jgi:hypothetical protein
MIVLCSIQYAIEPVLRNAGDWLADRGVELGVVPLKRPSDIVNYRVEGIKAEEMMRKMKKAEGDQDRLRVEPVCKTSRGRKVHRNGSRSDWPTTSSIRAIPRPCRAVTSEVRAVGDSTAGGWVRARRSQRFSLITKKLEASGKKYGLVERQTEEVCGPVSVVGFSDSGRVGNLLSDAGGKKDGHEGRK